MSPVCRWKKSLLWEMLMRELQNLKLQMILEDAACLSKEKCKNCFARFYCSGGCMANSYKFHGSIHVYYVLMLRVRWKEESCRMCNYDKSRIGR